VAWFDVLVVLLILLAIRSGKKGGISEELLPVGQWVLIVTANAFLNGPLAKQLSSFTKLSLFWSHLVACLFLAVAVFLLFIWIKSLVGGKLLEADYFGRHEYSLGVLGAVTRYLCMLLVALSVLNARHYTQDQILAIRRARAASDVRIALLPPLSSVQQQVFNESASGKLFRKHANFLLITPTPYDSSALRSDSVGRQRERLVEEVLDGGKVKAPPSTNTPPANAAPK